MKMELTTKTAKELYLVKKEINMVLKGKSQYSLDYLRGQMNGITSFNNELKEVIYKGNNSSESLYEQIHFIRNLIQEIESVEK